MLTYLVYFDHLFGPFRLFGYITFRCILAAILALVIGFCIAPRILKKLQALKMAQVLRDSNQVGALAALHSNKKNIPTFGGIIIYLTLMLTTLLCAKITNVYVIVSLLVYTVLSVLGFIDDYLKVTKKNPKGLSSSWKWLVEGVLAFVVLFILLGTPTSMNHITEFWIPFYKEPLLCDMPYWFLFLFFFVVMCGSSNAINLTDGIDGLAIGCTVVVALSYGVLAYAAGHNIIANYLHISFVPGVEELAVICFGLVGAGLVFLWYNSHPAQIFMGDTGSLALGGLVGTVAFLTHQAILLIIIGGIFVIEALSVILQVTSFKMTKKRIFKMSPIHHHFELKGWHENKVVIRFWILSLIFALIGLSSLKLR